MSSPPDPLAEATARREAAQAVEWRTYCARRDAPWGLESLDYQALDDAWREAHAALVEARTAEATADREAKQKAEHDAWWAVERAHKRRAKPTAVAALEAELNEAKQRLVAACDAETRAREGR